MPITLNQFRCTNGHSFEANAKLRARCPECGVSTKRSFDSLVDKASAALEHKTDSEKKPIEHVEHVVTPSKHKGPVLVRQGRPRMAIKKATTVKKPEVKASMKPKHKVVSHAPIGSKVSAGLVKSHTIKRRGVVPGIVRRPSKTAVARSGIQGHEQRKPYWYDVADKYGF